MLSEVGMLPAHLMGLKPYRFRRLNDLIKNKRFTNSLIQSVLSILALSKTKTNSIILNYDPKSNDFFNWYQQLVAESLGKKSKGILPFISFTVPLRVLFSPINFATKEFSGFSYKTSGVDNCCTTRACPLIQ